MCVNAVAMAIIFLYYHTNRTLATCHLSYTHVRLANVLLTIASSASFCLVAFAFLFMLNIKYTFSRCTIKTLMNLGRMKHACRSFKRFLIIRGSWYHDETSVYLFVKVAFALEQQSIWAAIFPAMHKTSFSAIDGVRDANVGSQTEAEKYKGRSLEVCIVFSLFLAIFSGMK